MCNEKRLCGQSENCPYGCGPKNLQYTIAAACSLAAHLFFLIIVPAICFLVSKNSFVASANETDFMHAHFVSGNFLPHEQLVQKISVGKTGLKIDAVKIDKNRAEAVLDKFNQAQEAQAATNAKNQLLLFLHDQLAAELMASDSASSANQKKSLTLVFNLSASGAPSNIQILTSSGDFKLDAAVQKILAAINPATLRQFSPLPTETLQVTVVFV